jgi:hypothetical protein
MGQFAKNGHLSSDLARFDGGLDAKLVILGVGALES